MNQIDGSLELSVLQQAASLNDSKYHTPQDLASAVSNHIKYQKISSRSSNQNAPAGESKLESWINWSNIWVPEPALLDLFETLYATSLRSEEGQGIKVDIVYISKNDMFNDMVEYPWRAVPFTEEIPLSVHNLLKLARASDPQTSAIAVFHNDSCGVVIWGLIDQRDKLYTALRHQSQIAGDLQCGIFEARIGGPGRIIVHSGQEPIAELNVSTLVIGDPSWNVFLHGPVRERCAKGIQSLASRLTGQITFLDAAGITHDASSAEILNSVSKEYSRSISRLLLRIQGFHHGGAVLLTANTLDQHLDCKYGLTYDRITHGMEIAIKSTGMGDGVGHLLEQETLTSSLWFAALLSRVDGLILMDFDLRVHGFGVVIRCEDEPPAASIFRRTRWGTHEPLDYKQLGTRHRSMMRFCYEHPESVGLVVSQDGDVRAIARVGEQLTVWENVCPSGALTGQYPRCTARPAY